MLPIVTVAAFTLVSSPAIAEKCVSVEENDLDRNISVHCGVTPSATLDQDGRLWVAFVYDQRVYVSHSDDLGRHYSESVSVNAEQEDIEHNGENRPKIIVDDDHIYLSWTQKTSPRFTGKIRFSQSIDAGKTFEAPRTINDDNLFTGHRFESLYLTDSGHLYLTWIDKRDLESSISQGSEYTGAAVYYAVSSDEGKTFSQNYRVANHSCECCRIAIAPQGPENITILWRQIFGVTTRDHAIAVLTPNGQTLNMHRASYDEWQIDACPHHGPTMIQSSLSGDYHMSWFTNGDAHQGIYYGRFSFDSNEPEDVFQVDGNAGAGHPYLAEFNKTLYLVWKGFDGEQSLIQLIKSTDDGKSWSVPETLITTAQGSDHPLIVSGKNGLYLSWHSEEMGYVFHELTSTQSAKLESGE
ncbi:MAG: hypothetical protein COA96_13795 [SAR86 cluster bacterium]|uniref:Glycosyl hydrolase n=1 Tax=SAR86 cluster bacterium TaxID=2030880 RepID=A0A2A5ATP2_9GAMM|nr:MAG: hypothetical protein COA96_13795 [SAR86 cluster bacterium]